MQCHGIEKQCKWIKLYNIILSYLLNYKLKTNRLLTTAGMQETQAQSFIAQNLMIKDSITNY